MHVYTRNLLAQPATDHHFCVSSTHNTPPIHPEPASAITAPHIDHNQGERGMAGRWLQGVVSFANSTNPHYLYSPHCCSGQPLGGHG